jgi:uncharacterized membrane protein/uncharacterized membrane protein YbhN (UPF0104 family)
MRTHLSSLLKFAIGWPLSLLALFFIGKILYDQAPSVLPNIRTINPFLVASGLFCFILFYFLRSFIWYRIIKGYGHKISFKESGYMWSMSELKRYIPGNIWAVLGRAVLFSKHGVTKKEMGSGYIIEAALFVLGSVVVALLALPFLLPNYSEQIGHLIIILVGIILLLYIFNRKVFELGLPRFARNDGIKKVVHFLFPPFSIQENFLLILISSSALFFFGLGNYLVMSAVFGTDPQLLWQLIGVFVFAFVTGYLSFITPAGIGVREGITIYALTKIVSAGLAAFAALFTRVVLIVAELLFILMSYLWFKSENTFVARAEKWIAKYPYESIVVFMGFLYTVYLSAVSFLRYEHYYTGRFDLGNMVQTVWNTVHGNFFMMTNPDGIEQVSRLAFHADFILILLAPLYALWQDPKMLLLIQSAVIGAGALFVYLIANEVIKNKNISLVLAFAYLINPSLQRANMYDFHAVVLATTFLLATFYFLLKKKYWMFILFAVMAAICKEQIWLIIALFGLLFMILHKKWLWGASIFIVCVGMFFFLVDFAIPNSLRGNHFAIEYYSDFGSSPLDIAKSIILSPDRVIETAMEPERMKFLRQILSPLGYISLAFPFFLIFAGPDLLISILSSNANLYQIYYQYTATMTPFIFISAIYGCWVVLQLNKLSFLQKQESRFLVPPKGEARPEGGKSGMTISVVLIAYILYWSLHTAYMFGPMPGSKEPNIAMFTKPFPDKQFIDQFIANIPQDATVSASNNLGSHLSQREVIYVLPHAIDTADLILISDKDNYAASTIEAKASDSAYQKIVERDGFTVFERK